MVDPTRAPDTLEPTARAQLVRLRTRLRAFERLMVAFSGGVDSTLLLHVAVDTLGSERVLAVLADSPSLARSEYSEALALAKRIGAPLRVLDTEELEDPRYAANPVNRCYFCKSELFNRLRTLAQVEGIAAIADGTNRDDVGDFRPGRQAAAENAVVSPLLDVGLGKAEVRTLSRAFGLPTWDKPATPCLASRIPYGESVSAYKLGQIERAEAVLRAHGIRGARVRHYGALARLELPGADLARLADPDLRAAIVDGVRRAGSFDAVTVDPEGYRQGRLNEIAAASLRPGGRRAGEAGPG